MATLLASARNCTGGDITGRTAQLQIMLYLKDKKKNAGYFFFRDIDE